MFVRSGGEAFVRQPYNACGYLSSTRENLEEDVALGLLWIVTPSPLGFCCMMHGPSVSYNDHA